MAAGERLGFLDALRGLAAIYVVIFHVQYSDTRTLAAPAALSDFIHFGHTSVWLFFVISAFSLCLTMPAHLATGHGLVSFFAGRFFRIAPLFYFMIAFQTAYLFLAHDYVRSLTTIVGSASFLFNFVPGFTGGAVSAGWSVGAEMAFYLVFPLLYFHAAGLGVRLALTALFIAIYAVLKPVIPTLIADPHAALDFQNHSLLRFMPSFLLGMIAFDLYVRLRDSVAARPAGVAATAVGLVVLAAQMTWRGGFWIIEPVHLDSLGYASLVLGLGLLRLRLFDAQPFAYLGRVSFSIYLWHIPAIMWLAPAEAAIYAHAPSPAFAFATLCAVVLLVTIALAHLSWLLIERPFGRLRPRAVARWAAMEAAFARGAAGWLPLRVRRSGAALQSPI